MKGILALLCCSLLIPAASWAQESDTESSQAGSAQQAESGGETSEKAASSGAFMQEQGSEEVRSSQLVGSAIVNASDQEIGKIDELLLNKEGQVVGIIVGVGGFLGMGGKDVALSWDAVEITSSESKASYQVKTEVDKAALENAEAFKTQEEKQAEQQQKQQEDQKKQQEQMKQEQDEQQQQ